MAFPDDLTPPPREKSSIIQEGQWRDELWRYIQAGAALLSGGVAGQFFRSLGPGVGPEWVTGHAFIGLQTFTASGNWLKTTNNPKLLVAFLLGAGGGGGGAPLTTAGQISVGSGGGAGGWLIKVFQTSSLADTVAITIGANGTGSAGGNGVAGGDTIFSTATAKGGSAGSFGSAVAGTRAVTGGAGGVPTTGDINGTGARGDYGFAFPSPALEMGGKGADSILGGGGAGAITTSGASAGSNASGFGGGGGGGANGITGNAAVAGGSGTDGFAAIFEFA